MLGKVVGTMQMPSHWHSGVPWGMGCPRILQTEARLHSFMILALGWMEYQTSPPRISPEASTPEGKCLQQLSGPFSCSSANRNGLPYHMILWHFLSFTINCPPAPSTSKTSGPLMFHLLYLVLSGLNSTQGKGSLCTYWILSKLGINKRWRLCVIT